MRFLTLLIALASLQSVAAAQTTECRFQTGLVNQNGAIHYRVNTSLASSVGMTADQFIATVVYAAEVWNEEANSGYFVFDGTTNKTFDNITCSDGFSVVSLFENLGPTGGDLAQTDFTCASPNRHNFKMRVDANGECVVHGDFIVCPGGSRTYIPPKDVITSTQTDLAPILIHQFGHALGLTHGPSESLPFSVMQASPGAGSFGHHDLYQWDIQCVEQHPNGGRRSVFPFRRYQVGGVFQAEANISDGIGVSHASVGLGFNGTALDWAMTLQSSTEAKWKFGIAHLTSGLVSVPYTAKSFETSWSTNTRTQVWREYGDTKAYVTYPTVKDWPTSLTTGIHQLRYVVSDDGFTTATRGNMSYCQDMATWNSCSGTVPLYSARPISVTYNETLNVDVVAWLAQDPAAPNSYGSVYLSTQRVDDATLGEPDKNSLSGRSVVSVACGDTGYVDDCVLVHGGPFMAVRTFHLNWSSTEKRYVPIYTYQETLQVATGNQVALWWSNDKFWLAYKSAEAGQPIRILSSATGNAGTWSASSANPGFSVTGPSAVSYWNGNNALMYIR